jgi:hypothetical protein
MPTAKELSIELDDRPGTLANACKALADRGVNIVAIQASPNRPQNKSLVRVVVDNQANAKAALDSQHLSYTETEVAQVRLPNRAGELARAASRLAEANINIQHAYCGLEPGTNTPLLIFGVAEVGRAVALLDQAAAAGR